MASPGLRERKRARTRQLIADAAARLFAERGYENVAVTDVAREAEVAEQTVYNYFPTKEQLVTDREQQIQDRLCDLIRSRPPGVTPAAAVRDFVLESVAGIGSIPADLWRGELGYLAAISRPSTGWCWSWPTARRPPSLRSSATPPASRRRWPGWRG
jgi:AcrR family transcriptional regulator